MRTDFLMRIPLGFVIAVLVFLIASCTKGKSKLELALELAGDNRQELEKVIDLYDKEDKDSLKLRAAYYLIENMPYHFTNEEYFISPEGDKYRPDLSLFDNADAVKRHCDSLERIGYRVSKKRLYDIKELGSEFLINNIELAFDAWQKPWSKDVPFEEFCRYILPYKAQIENSSPSRREMMNRFTPILDSANVGTPLEACIVLNEKLKDIIRYQRRGLTFYPTIEETYTAGISECEGLCNLGTFIMRAAGIPIAVDQTTWVKMDLSHSWCTVWDNGKFHSFGPGEDQPGVHAQLNSEIRHRTPAKVYRSSFDPYSFAEEVKDDGYITYLKSPLLEDVTHEYLDKTTTIRVSIDKASESKEQSDLVYLCTFNSYEWTPVAIGYKKDSLCFFDEVVGDNIFAIAEAVSKNVLHLITIPFYVNKEGDVRKFIPDFKNKETFTFNKRPKRQEQTHTLQYWDTQKGGFVSLNYSESTDTTQSYNQIPKNALLWFTIPERIVNQRLSFIDEGQIRSY